MKFINIKDRGCVLEVGWEGVYGVGKGVRGWSRCALEGAGRIYGVGIEGCEGGGMGVRGVHLRGWEGIYGAVKVMKVHKRLI